MREPPPDIDTDDLLAAVRTGWDVRVTRVDHVPLGFGAHHWAAFDSSGPILFVTFDGPTRPVTELETAYAGAVALRRAGLEFVLAPLQNRSGSTVARFSDGVLSCTPWQQGDSGGRLDIGWTRHAMARLHAVPPPDEIPSWKPLVSRDFAADVELGLEQPWGPGPYADRARKVVRDRLVELARWTARYHELATLARERAWVPTHGEPHSDNQLLTSRGRYLVDWESLKLAPPERDLRVLLDAGAQVDADPKMVEMFDLEWRLDEINQYVAWFATGHSGTEDDRIAFAGLLDELNRE